MQPTIAGAIFQKRFINYPKYFKSNYIINNHIMKLRILRVDASYECASSNVLLEKMIGHRIHICNLCVLHEQC